MIPIWVLACKSTGMWRVMEPLGTSRISGMVALPAYCWRQYLHKRRHWSWFWSRSPSIGKNYSFTMPLLLPGQQTPGGGLPAFHWSGTLQLKEGLPRYWHWLAIVQWAILPRLLNRPPQHSWGSFLKSNLENYTGLPMRWSVNAGYQFKMGRKGQWFVFILVANGALHKAGFFSQLNAGIYLAVNQLVGGVWYRQSGIKWWCFDLTCWHQNYPIYPGL